MSIISNHPYLDATTQGCVIYRDYNSIDSSQQSIFSRQLSNLISDESTDDARERLRHFVVRELFIIFSSQRRISSNRRYISALRSVYADLGYNNINELHYAIDAYAFGDIS